MEAVDKAKRSLGICQAVAERYVCLCVVRVISFLTGLGGGRRKREPRQLTTYFTEPNPDDAVEVKIADQYKNDRAGYEKEAKDWVKRYATPKK